jgi:hypothetical protein
MTHAKTREKFKVYELDFCDTNLLSENISDITEWIANDMAEMDLDTPLQYRVSIRMMTRKQISEIPEWA